MSTVYLLRTVLYVSNSHPYQTWLGVLRLVLQYFRLYKTAFHAHINKSRHETWLCFKFAQLLTFPLGVIGAMANTLTSRDEPKAAEYAGGMKQTVLVFGDCNSHAMTLICYTDDLLQTKFLRWFSTPASPAYAQVLQVKTLPNPSSLHTTHRRHRNDSSATMSSTYHEKELRSRTL